MAAASTTTSLNDDNGTALVAGDRVQATDSDRRGTVVSFTAKRVRIKWDGVDYPSTRHYAQVVPTKVRKIEADEEAEIIAAEQRAEATAEGIAQRAADATQAERDRVADAITEVAAIVAPRYFRKKTQGTALHTGFGLDRHDVRILTDGGVATWEQLGGLVDAHLNCAKGSALSSIKGAGKNRIGKVVRAVLLWRDLTGQGAEDIADQAPEAPAAEAAEAPELDAEAPEATPGTAVTIRPEGAKRATRALVLSATGAMVRVWVPTLGTPGVQGSIQELRTREVLRTEALANCPGSWVVHNRRRASKDGSYEQLPKDVWAAFCEASDAHHAAYKAKHATKK